MKSNWREVLGWNLNRVPLSFFEFLQMLGGGEITEKEAEDLYPKWYYKFKQYSETYPGDDEEYLFEEENF